jgi:two-component system sensor histidine kinase KdpD
MDLFWRKHGSHKLLYQLYCVLVTALTTAASVVLSLQLHRLGLEKENLLMVFLVGVLLTTVFTRGYIYGFLSSAASIFLFDYYFTSPVFTFIISNRQDLVLLVFFLIAALISGMLSHRLRRQSELAEENARVTLLLNEITESFLNLSGIDNIVENGMARIQDQTGLCCRVTLTQKVEGKPQVFPGRGFSESQPVLLECPIQGKTQQLGTLQVSGAAPKPGEEADTIIRAVATQMGLVLDREFIDAERERIKLEMESEHLKATLLRSVSHDIRTPLTGIMGASSTILDDYDHLSDADILRLAQDINDDSAWLIMTVQNISRHDAHLRRQADDPPGIRGRRRSREPGHPARALSRQVGAAARQDAGRNRAALCGRADVRPGSAQHSRQRLQALRGKQPDPAHRLLHG